LLLKTEVHQGVQNKITRVREHGYCKDIQGRGRRFFGEEVEMQYTSS
jgi:hypothetical protein